MVEAAELDASLDVGRDRHPPFSGEADAIATVGAVVLTCGAGMTRQLSSEALASPLQASGGSVAPTDLATRHGSHGKAAKTSAIPNHQELTIRFAS